MAEKRINYSADKINELLNKTDTLSLPTKVKLSSQIGLHTNHWEMLKYVMTNFDDICVDVDVTVDAIDEFYLTRSIRIFGNKTIKFTSSTGKINLIHVNENNLSIKLENIGLDLAFEGRLFVGGRSDGYMTKDLRSFRVEGCDITGQGLVCMFYVHLDEEGADDTNPLPHVIETIFDNNNIHDLTMSWTTLPPRVEGGTANNYQLYGLFTVQNLYTDYISLCGNTIRNTERSIGQFKDRVFSSDAVDNELVGFFDAPYTNKRIVVKYNNLKNDDDCWGSNYIDAMYYVFVMGEAEEVVYEYNYLEGMKIKVGVNNESIGAETYDFYAAAVNYFNRHNTVKNCTHLYNDEKHYNSAKSPLFHELFKNKRVENLYIENNVYVIEEDFLAKHEDPAYPTSRRYKLVDLGATYRQTEAVIRNNIIHVPILYFEGDRNSFTRSYTIDGNYMKARQISGYPFYHGMSYGSTLCRVFTNNKLIATENCDETFKLLHVGETGQLQLGTTLHICNNYLNMPNFYNGNDINGTATTKNNDRFSIYCMYNDTIIKDNIFPDAFVFKKGHGNFTIKNNTYKKNTKLTFADDKYRYPSQLLTDDEIQETIPLMGSDNTFKIILGEPTADKNRKVIISAKAYGMDGKVYSINRLITYVANQSITYVDGNGTTQTDTGLSNNAADIEIEENNMVIQIKHSSYSLLSVYSTANTTFSHIDIYMKAWQ